MAKGPKRLGRGLASLVSVDESKIDSEADGRKPLIDEPTPGLPVPRTTARLLALPLGRIRTNPMQPRRRFDEAGLEALAVSLRDKGALQPVVVRQADGGFELVAGERRLRAAKMAGLDEIPAIVRAVRDDELLELALIENIHRADLNAMERARAYRVMHERQGLSHEEIAQRVGEDRTTVVNYLRLLTLGDDVQDLISGGDLGIGHAKALLGCEDIKAQLSYARRVLYDGWSVRRLEAAITCEKRPRSAGGVERRVRPAVKDLEEQLGAVLGTRVLIREGRRRHTGRLVIEYKTLDDFERIVGLLGIREDVP